MSHRKFFVGGNWKCNGTKASNAELVAGLNAAQIVPDVEVVVAPVALHIESVRAALRKDFEVGAQNIYTEPKGAFTGEISAEQLKDLGLHWTIIGHSERRTIFKETDELIAKKTAHAIEAGLSVIGCLGETLAEFDANQTEAVVTKQMAAYAGVVKDWSKFVIAYEPVWAIGTGKTATPARSQEVQSLLRHWIAANVSNDVAKSVRILYGGSVTAANADDLSKQPDVDGFLVGGASLKAPDFTIIINAAKNHHTKST